MEMSSSKDQLDFFYAVPLDQFYNEKNEGCEVILSKPIRKLSTLSQPDKIYPKRYLSSKFKTRTDNSYCRDEVSTTNSEGSGSSDSRCLSPDLNVRKARGHVSMKNITFLNIRIENSLKQQWRENIIKERKKIIKRFIANQQGGQITLVN